MMLSDAISEFVEQVDYYTTHPKFRDCYDDWRYRKRLLEIRTELEKMRQDLDTPPTTIDHVDIPQLR